MKKGLQVVYRGIEYSKAVDRNIRKNVTKLERYCDKITGCRIVIDVPHNNHKKGKQYHITIDVSVPNGEIVANNLQHDNAAHENIYAAIRDAFNATQRQLKSECGRQRSRWRSFSKYRLPDLDNDELAPA